MLDLETNEFDFLASHRSAVWDLGFARLFVSSDRAVKTWNFIGSISMKLDVPAAVEVCERVFADWKMTPCFKITPLTQPSDFEKRLIGQGWGPTVVLTHMVLRDPSAAVSHGGEITTRVCATIDDIRQFTEIQCAGFGAPAWAEWVGKINAINLPRSNQRFYIADLNGKPAGVCLLLVSGQVAGLYAVATLEESRGRGVARSLIERSRQDASRLGATTLCLNTAAGGPAESAFTRAGFERVFESRFLTRA